MKIYIFVRKMPLLRSLMLDLKSDLFKPRSYRQLLLIWPDVKTWKNVYYMLSGAATFGLLMWLMFPILSGSYRTYALPFFSWYPYDITKPLIYKLTYLHQTASSFLLILGCFNIDMLISALMMYTGAQCDILCDNLRSTGFEMGDFEKTFRRCVLHHKRILRYGRSWKNFWCMNFCRFANTCDDFFKVILFGQFLYSSVCIATTLFRVASVT